jgi:hypothetical protein
MKKTFLLLFFLFFSSKILSQQYFEGVISFKTAVTATKTIKLDVLNNLSNKFGDSLQMFYTREGNFKRKYFNNDETGLDYQTYNAEAGKLFIKNKNSDIVQTSDVSVNSLKLISLNKLDNEMIMNLECECYEYKGRLKEDDNGNQNVVLTFCFSPLLPKVDIKAFENYNDFFINDYFRANERPYLKYIMKTDAFTLSFTAVKIMNIALNNKSINKDVKSIPN